VRLSIVSGFWMIFKSGDTLNWIVRSRALDEAMSNELKTRLFQAKAANNRLHDP
jgi:hypothetical protein